jgi:heterotetrameric sarcosine oxidase gamma subunit
MIYDVSINQLELFCVFDLKGSRTDISPCLARLNALPPETPNTMVVSENITLCWVGPTRWILLAPHSEEEYLISEFEMKDSSEHDVSTVEISDTLQLFSIQGRDADDILAICCPIDIHMTTFADNAVTYTEMFGTKVLVLRDTHGFQIAVERSYADFINDSLHRILGKPLPVNHAGRPARNH